MILDIIIQEENMQTKHYLTLSDAEFLLNKAHQYAIDHAFNVSIAIVDETGNLWQ